MPASRAPGGGSPSKRDRATVSAQTSDSPTQDARSRPGTSSRTLPHSRKPGSLESPKGSVWDFRSGLDGAVTAPRDGLNCLAPGQIDSRAMTEAVADSDSFVSPDTGDRSGNGCCKRRGSSAVEDRRRHNGPVRRDRLRRKAEAPRAGKSRRESAEFSWMRVCRRRLQGRRGVLLLAMSRARQRVGCRTWFSNQRGRPRFPVLRLYGKARCPRASTRGDG